MKYLLILLSFVLVGCSDDTVTYEGKEYVTPPTALVPVQQPQVVYVEKDSGMSVGDALMTGMLINAITSDSSSGYDDRRPVVHNTTVVNKTTVVKNKTKKVYTAPKPKKVKKKTYIPPVKKRSFSSKSSYSKSKKRK